MFFNLEIDGSLEKFLEQREMAANDYFLRVEQLDDCYAGIAEKLTDFKECLYGETIVLLGRFPDLWQR